jgi:formate transporter
MPNANNHTPPLQFNAFLPREMARRAEQVGVNKATMPAGTTFALAILAGAFIGLGAMFATIVTTDPAGALPFGVTKLLGGVVFSLGLILVIVAGAELFTGNNLIVMAVASGHVTFTQLLRNWIIVYVGNFVGAVATAGLVFFSGQATFASGQVGAHALAIAEAKCSLGFVQAIALGILCNALVCLAVWLCFSARSTTDKIVAIIFPVTAFVAAGFEHSIANMYFIPFGLFTKASLGTESAAYLQLTWSNFFFSNLLPVTIGNIIGGALLVGLVYWFIYLRAEDSENL